MALQQKKRVLAIDDEAAMTEWLKIVLEHAGYEVRTAFIGARGEEVCRSWRPDAVVADMQLPDMDGVELVRRIRQVDADVEVLVMTASGRQIRFVDAIHIQDPSRVGVIRL